METIKIAVLGLGSSISEYKADGFAVSIGVNDIWRYHHTEAVVVLNPPKDFIPAERYKVVSECRPQSFYSQLVMYDTRPDFVKIMLQGGYPDLICNLDSMILPKSYCSPFVACVIALKYYYADQIDVYGVDLLDHPHLKSDLCNKIRIHFIHLKQALEAKNCKLIIHGQGILKDI